MSNTNNDRPEQGKTYRLTGGPRSIANGDSWADSAVSDESNRTAAGGGGGDGNHGVGNGTAGHGTAPEVTPEVIGRCDEHDGSYVAEVFVDGDWHSNGLRFPSAAAADLYARDWQARWSMVADCRVVTSTDAPTTCSRTVDWAERGAARPDADAPAWRVSL